MSSSDAKTTVEARATGRLTASQVKQRLDAELVGNFAFDRISLGNFNGTKIHEVDEIRVGNDPVVSFRVPATGDYRLHVANLGFGEVRFPRPVRAGDTLYAESEVLEVTPSRSKPDRGVVKVHTRVYKQDGTLVAEFKRAVLVPRKEPGDGS